MSLIHLDKSVLTFHFKEILEDGHFGGPLTLVSLGALLVGPKLLSNLVSTPATTPALVPSSSPYRPGMSLSAWVAQQQQASSTTGNPGASLAMTNNAETSDRLAA
jgi:hypothetical protein